MSSGSPSDPNRSLLARWQGVSIYRLRNTKTVHEQIELEWRTHGELHQIRIDAAILLSALAEVYCFRDRHQNYVKVVADDSASPLPFHSYKRTLRPKPETPSE